MKGRYLQKYFPPANCQRKYLLCLGLPDAVGGANCPLLQALVNVKLGPLLNLYFFFSILLDFSKLFLRFSEYILVIEGFGIAIHIRIHHHFSVFFWVLLVTPNSCQWIPFSYVFFPATDCWQSALTKKKFIKMFCICMMNKNLHHYLLLAFTTLEIGDCQEAQNAITSTSRTINNIDNCC